MGWLDDLEMTRLFDEDSGYGKKYRFGELTEEMIERAEKTMGYPLPPSYRELLKMYNGGAIHEALGESWLSVIYGIAEDPANGYGLEWAFENWKDEWEYPDIGIPFGETQSAGHDMYYMDFRSVAKNGEPRIVRIDNEMDNTVFYVAENLAEFLGMILRNEPIEERGLEE